MPAPKTVRLSYLARQHLDALAKMQKTTETTALMRAIEMIYLDVEDDPRTDWDKKQWASFRLPRITTLQLRAIQARWQTNIAETLTVVLDRVWQAATLIDASGIDIRPQPDELG